MLHFSAHRLLPGLLCLAGALLAPSTARADEYRFTEHQVSAPSDIVCNMKTAPDGSLWFVEEGATRLGRFDLKTGEVEKFAMPGLTLPYVGEATPYPSTLAIGPCDLTFAPDGNLWFNLQQANVLGYVEPEPPYRMRTLRLTPASVPMSLATGADGMIYATLTGANKIARVDPKTEHITYFDVPTPGSGIIGGTPGRDGAHWFVEWFGNKILRFDYATHEMREYPVPTPASGPIVIRWIDGALWFTEMFSAKIARLDPATGKIDEVELPGAGPTEMPISLVEGRDGDIYSDEAAGDKIARIDPDAMKVVAEYPIPSKGTFPEEITKGPDGAIWFPESLNGRLGRLWVDSFGRDPGAPPR